MKSLLEVRRRHCRTKRFSSFRVTPKGLNCSTAILLAIVRGKNEGKSQSFTYFDALNSWRCETFFKASEILSAAILAQCKGEETHNRDATEHLILEWYDEELQIARSNQHISMNGLKLHVNEFFGSSAGARIVSDFLVSPMHIVIGDEDVCKSHPSALKLIEILYDHCTEDKSKYKQ